MGTKAVAIDSQHVMQLLQQARKQVDAGAAEVIVDFSPVRRLDTQALGALEELAGVAQQRSSKLVLRGVNVDVYKVLKLMKLARRFAFVS